MIPPSGPAGKPLGIGYQEPSTVHMMASTVITSMQMMVRRPMRFIAAC